MADDTSTTSTEDTGLSTDDTAEDVALEDFEINLDDLKDDSEEEADEAATESEESEQSDAQKETAEESEDESQDESGETEDAEGEVTDPEAEKKRAAQEAYKLREEARRAKEEARQIKEAKEAEDVKRYLAEAEDDAEELARRELNVQAYYLQQEQAKMNDQKLQIGIDKALANETVAKLLNSSDVVKNQILDSLDDFERMYVQKDKHGNILEVNGDVYSHLVKKAEAIQELTRVGAATEAKSKDKARARTLTPPSRSPKEPKVDKDLADFMRVFS